MVLRLAALDLSLESRQLVEQRRFVRLVCFHQRGAHLGEFLLGLSEPGCQALRDRQRQQRHEPVRVDLEQPLDHPTRLTWRHAAIQHDHPAESVVQAVVGEGQAGPAADPCADQHIAREIALRQRLDVGHGRRRRQQQHVRRDHQSP